MELHHGDYISLLPDSLIYRVELRLESAVWKCLMDEVVDSTNCNVGREAGGGGGACSLSGDTVSG